jgi:type II secretory pathway pseudopilin PulG
MSAKRTAIFNQGRGKQHGAVLTIMLVIMIVGIAAILVNSLSSATLKNARQKNTAAALAQAKDALIGFAITYSNTHTTSPQVNGYLPCPDIAGGLTEGSAELSCGLQDVSVIGRLPWATLDLSILRDGDGECLWYAVSGTYKDNPKTGLMNWDTNGQFQAYAPDGTTLLSNQVVAVIFAPGAPQSGQDRSDTTAPVCGGNYTATSYLDKDIGHSNIDNAAVATGIFIQGTSGGTVNDQMLFITKQDIWNAVQKRTDFQNTLKLMTQRVAECLANYGKHNSNINNKSLPWPAPLSLGTNALTDYYPNTNYDDTALLYAGRVPYNVATSKGTTGNTILTPYYLLEGPLSTGGAGVNNCPSADWFTKYYPWWSNWKEHLFYAIGQTFRPTLNTNQSCGGFNCLSINGSGQYAGVVIFAEQILSNQTRADKSVIAGYLEGNNASNVAGIPFPATGAENYQTAPVSSTFNDVLYCINADLTVIPCP